MRGLAVVFRAVCSIGVVGLLTAGLSPALAFAADETESLQLAAVQSASGDETSTGMPTTDRNGHSSELIVVLEDRSTRSSGMLSVQSDDDLTSSVAEAVDAQAVERLADSAGLGTGAVSLVQLPENANVEDAVAEAQQLPGVAFAQPNYCYRLMDEPLMRVDDPFASIKQDDANKQNQWWLDSLGMFDAWDIVRSEGKVTVAVLDTGVNFDHPDLKDNIDTVHAYDATLGEQLTEGPYDVEMAHGSHVAGIIAGVANNKRGIAGVSFNARVLPINVFQLVDGKAGCMDSDLIRAYEYLMSDDDGNGRTLAQETNTRVVNMSLGGYEQEDLAFGAIIDKASEQGILTVCAGGNGDDAGSPITSPSWPSDYESVVSVVPLDSWNERPHWADYNDAKDIAAPGIDIWSTWYTGETYYCSSGSSMASPMVAGVAALLFAYHPDLTVDEAKEALYSTAIDLGDAGRDKYYGWGKVNPVGALEALGAVAIGVEQIQPIVTSKQQLIPRVSSVSAASGSWVWSTDDESIAAVDEQGVLTARSPGSTVVRVSDARNASVCGKRAITVVNLNVPGGVVAMGSRSERCIEVSWKQASYAKEYRVERALSNQGVFEAVGAVESSDEDELMFKDFSIEPGVTYSYRVVPIGELDGAPVVGDPSASDNAFFTDKEALSSAIGRARAARDSVSVSQDGADVYEDQMWCSSASVAALDDAIAKAVKVSYATQATQERVDAARVQLEEALVRFEDSLAAGLMKRPDSQGDTPSGPGAPHKPSDDDESAGDSRSDKPGATETGADTPSASRTRTSLAKATISVAKASYTGKAVKPSVTLKLNGRKLSSGIDYRVSYRNNKKAGTATVIVSGIGSYEGTVTARFTIAKAANTLRAKAKAKVIKVKPGKRAAFKRAAVFGISRARGNVSFKKLSGPKMVSVSSRGFVTVRKGLAKGTHRVKVRVSAAGTANYRASAKTVVLVIRG